MTPDDTFGRAQELFLRARELPAGERAALLAGAAPPVRAQAQALLAGDASAAGGFLSSGARALAGALPSLGGLAADAAREAAAAAGAAAPMPAEIAGFAVRREIGSGGMGRVYEAEQRSPHRRVAVKVMKAGGVTRATLRRFELESEVLARLDHPGIARVYQAGTADFGQGPQPYLVMEYVEGAELDAHVRKAGEALGLAGRLELLAKVCEAVHHAHQRGVIHRDLKPSNILVTAGGEPRVLDFGVARVTTAALQSRAGLTRDGQILGTLRYMSPEQTVGDPDAVDVTSDVYALGVIAFEVLTGRGPYASDPKTDLNVLLAIRGEAAAPLRRVDPRLPRDVECVVGKALSKEGARRYASAAEMAADLRRVLAHEPVVARPPSTWYQVSMFTRRNRMLTAAAAALVLSLAAGVIGTAVGLSREAQQRQLAEANAARAGANAARAESEAAAARAEARNKKAVADFYVELLDAGNPALWGRKMDVEQLYWFAADRLKERQVSDDPLVDAKIRQAVGLSLIEFGELDLAAPLVEAAYATASAALPPGDRQVIDALQALMRLRLRQGRRAEAEEAARQYVERVRARRMPLPISLVFALENYASVLMSCQKFADADRQYQELLPLLGAIPDAFEREVGGILSGYAQLKWVQGRPAEAMEIMGRAEALLRKHRETHKLARVLTTRACWLADGGAGRDLPAAEAAIREAIKLIEANFGARHDDLATALGQLSYVLCWQKKHVEAEATARRALAMHQEVLPAYSAGIAIDHDLLAMVLEAAGKDEAAAREYEAALALYRKEFPGGSLTYVKTLWHFAELRHRLKDFAAAEALLREELGLRVKVLGAANAETIRCADLLLGLLDRQGRAEESAPIIKGLEAALPAAGRAAAWSDDEWALGVFVHDIYAQMGMTADVARVEARMPAARVAAARAAAAAAAAAATRPAGE